MQLLVERGLELRERLVRFGRASILPICNIINSMTGLLTPESRANEAMHHIARSARTAHLPAGVRTIAAANKCAVRTHSRLPVVRGGNGEEG